MFRRKSNTITRLLGLPDKGVNSTRGANSILSRLFRQMLWDLNISNQLYGSLLTKYVKDPRNKVPNSREERSQEIGNLTKSFGKPDMSNKVFVKALRLLQFEEVEFIIKGKSRITGKETIHSTKLHMGDYDDIAQMEQEEAEREHND